MRKTLRILHLEDEPDFSDLLGSLFKKEGLEAEIRLMSARSDFEEAAVQGDFDLILADYLLPGYTGLDALRFAREHAPETPFIMVSGTIGEQAAVDTLNLGATDYVLKLYPEKLIPAIRRAIKERDDQTQRKKIETELTRRECYFQALTENALDIVSSIDKHGILVYNSPSVLRTLGYAPAELAGKSALGFIHPEDAARTARDFLRGIRRGKSEFVISCRFRHRDGSWRDMECVGNNRLNEPEIGTVIVNSRDISERKQAQQKLLENEEQYRLMFDSNPTPIFVFDAESLTILEVNTAALNQYGCSRSEFLGVDEFALNLADFRKKVSNLLTDEGKPVEIWSQRKKDGSLVDIEVQWNRVNFRGRKALLIMANDVTERTRNEHRERALSKLAQRLSSASSAKDAAEIIRSVADDLFDWDAFTLDLYSDLTDLIYPILNVDTDRSGKRFEIAANGNEKAPSKMGRRILTRGAELILRQEPIIRSNDAIPIGDVSRPSASLALTPIRYRTQVIGILAIHSYQVNAYSQSDLFTLQTLADHCGGALERIRAERALHESETRFHSVWQNSVDGMRLTDQNGTMVAVNEAFCKLVGMTREELEGQPFTIIYANADQSDRALEKYRQRFRDRVIEKHIERQLTLRNGSVVNFEDTNSFVELNGRPTLLLGLFRDVTIQKRLEEQLRQSQKMEAIGQLAGGVAHDFNNILTVIQGHSSLLMASGGLKGIPFRSAQQIGQAAERAAGLTRQLLTFSRRQLIQPRPLDLNEVLQNMTKMLERILGEDIVLKLEYHHRPAVVQADASMLEQTLLNLAVNSRDAMPKGGKLSLKIFAAQITDQHVQVHPEARLGSFCCLEASDTGCGIAKENLRRVFEPFFTTKEVGKGTGLGLATVYGVAKQHQGWVEVDSQLGKGTTFRVYFPAFNAAVIREDSAQSPAIRGGKETILVVEDEAAVRELVSSLLAQHGYKILEAESGPKAIEVWKTEKDSIDLVLTDLVMPDRMNGRELAEKLWNERPELKIIFTSGYSADVVGKDFVLRGGLNFLQKPYNLEKLAITVRTCLDALN